MNTAKVEEGATVGDFGMGGIDLSGINGATMAKAGRIIAIDINESKFEPARKRGAADCINPKKFDKPILDVIVGLTGGRVCRGLAFGGVKGRLELRGIDDRYLHGAFKVDAFITRTMGLDRINEAFDLMQAGKSIRIMIHFDR